MWEKNGTIHLSSAFFTETPSYTCSHGHGKSFRATEKKHNLIARNPKQPTVVLFRHHSDQANRLVPPTDLPERSNFKNLICLKVIASLLNLYPTSRTAAATGSIRWSEGVWCMSGWHQTTLFSLCLVGPIWFYLIYQNSIRSWFPGGTFGANFKHEEEEIEG